MLVALHERPSSKADITSVRLRRYKGIYRQRFHDADEVSSAPGRRRPTAIVEWSLLLTFVHRYCWLYLLVLKSFLVYVSDIFSAITMLTTESWSNEIFNRCPKLESEGCVFIPFSVGQWLFLGCIIFSFLLVSCKLRSPATPPFKHAPIFCHLVSV